MDPDRSSTDLAANVKDLLDDAISEIHNLYKMSEEDRNAIILPLTTYPYKIPISNGRFYPTSKRGYDSVRKAGRLWRDNNPSAKASIRLSEIDAYAIDSFGDIISGEALAAYSPEDKLKDVFQGVLGDRIQGAIPELAQYFPCQIFSEPCKSFSVGPVAFLSILDWLEYVQKRADRHLAWVDVLRWWCESKTLFPKSMDELLAATGKEYPQISAITITDLEDARYIANAIGRAYLIAVVVIDRRSQSLADECARLAVTVAIDCIALAIDHRYFKEIRGPLESLDPTMTRRLRQLVSRDIPQGWTLEMPGILGGWSGQNLIIDRTELLRKSSGDTISAFISPDADGKLKVLRRHWFEAMHWFGDAWRSRSEPITIVKIGIALDILAQGGEDRAIQRLACALFRREAKEKFANGFTIRKLVGKIYKEGRSQIGHGGKLALLDEPPVDISIAVQFAKDMFLQYILALASYSGEDQLDSFVSYLNTAASPLPP